MCFAIHAPSVSRARQSGRPGRVERLVRPALVLRGACRERDERALRVQLSLPSFFSDAMNVIPATRSQFAADRSDLVSRGSETRGK
jgi:hypothetical protein